MKKQKVVNFQYDFMIRCYFHDMRFHVVDMIEIKSDEKHENMQHHILIL